MNWISWLVAKYYSIEFAVLAHERDEFERAFSRWVVREMLISAVVARVRKSAQLVSKAVAGLGPSIDEAAAAFVALGKLIHLQVSQNGRDQSATDPRRDSDRAGPAVR